jgi:hypothetical protein
MKPEDETLESIINTERDLVLNAEAAHGEYFTHAVQMATLLNNLVPSIDIPTRFLFVAFLSQVKKHIVLALFSAVRRHHVQAGMNLRQVLEASAWAAYALAHEDLSLFRIEGPRGLEVPDHLKGAMYRWLATNYPVKSEEMKRLKDKINSSVAHANIAYAFQTFGLGKDKPGFTTSYFDSEDAFRIKTDLVMVANTAMGVVQVFSTVNMAENVFRFPAGFVEQFRSLSDQHERLRTEIRGNERFRDFAPKGLCNSHHVTG